MSDYRKALLWTAIPIVVIGLISVVDSVVRGIGGFDFYDLNFVWFGAVACWFLAVLAAVGFTIAGKRQIASGIFAGVAIGILALGVTCFANLATAQW
jgi:hypothetical protein